MMQVLLVTNSKKQQASEAVGVTADWLGARGIGFEHISSERLLISDPYLAERSASVSQFDLVVCFGGDGTILRVSRMIGGSGVPLLAFNFGGMGFLASAPAEALVTALESAVEGRASVDERYLAEIEVAYDDGSSESHTALNEVVISRGNFGRIVCLDLFINGNLLEKTRGDGVLVSTATGSTAYALSAGGPLVDPRYNGLVVVPISPHTLKSWSIVTGPVDVVALKPSVDNEQRIVLFLDGEVLWSTEDALSAAAMGNVESEPNDPTGYRLSGPEVLSVAIRPSQACIKLLRPSAHDFYEQISLAFFGSAYDR
jgi:NAD+ kinase